MRQHTIQINRNPDAKKIALYVHIPFCQAKCSYCNFYSIPIKNFHTNPFISAIVSELDRWQDFHENIHTIYIGGGSPSCLPTEQFKRLILEIKPRCGEVEEFTVEVNCAQVDLPKLLMLRKAGVDRLSIGAQSFSQQQLNLLGRRHKPEAVNQAVTAARHAGFKNISLDLIFAIPGSSLAFWQYSLERAIELDVEHISAYSLSIEKGTVLEHRLKCGEIIPVDEEVDAAMYQTAIDMLTKAGLERYEISNFAKPGFECRHNLCYWANNEFIGIGPAASSYMKNQRWANVSDIEKYIKGIETAGDVTVEGNKLTATEITCETAVLNLRRSLGINLDEFIEKTGYDAEKLFAEPIKKYLNLGLLAKDKRRLFLTPKALPIADSVLCDFSSL